MCGDSAAQVFPGFLIRGPFELAGEVAAVPTDDAVLDQPVTGFGDLLPFLFGLDELAGVSDGHCAREPIGKPDLIELFLDGLSQGDVIDTPQDKGVCSG